MAGLSALSGAAKNKNKIQETMAKKKEEGISLIDTFSEFKETKNIDRTTMKSWPTAT